MTATDQSSFTGARPPARTLTLDDVAEMSATDEVHRYELDEGTLLMMAPADVGHGAIVMRITAWLLAHGHDPARLLVDAGLRVTGSSGRTPDLLLLKKAVDGENTVDGDTVWIGPDAVELVVEVVSKGSKKVDRLVKPGEYARAAIPHFWRVERDGPPTVHRYALGTGEQGEAAYVAHQAVLLDELLAAPPPSSL